MRTITRFLDKKEIVTTGKEEVKFYVTEDGKEFANLNDAKLNEKRIEKNKEFRREFTYHIIENEAGYTTHVVYLSETNRDIINKLEYISYQIRYNVSYFKKGWNFIVIDDTSGDEDTISVYSLEDYINIINQRMKNSQNFLSELLTYRNKNVE